MEDESTCAGIVFIQLSVTMRIEGVGYESV